MRLLIRLDMRKAAQQLGLFGARPSTPASGGAPAPSPAPAPAPRPAAPAPLHPPGAGWLLIQGSKRSGYHRRKADGKWEWWYPTTGVQAHPHPEDAHHVPPEEDRAPEPSEAPRPTLELRPTVRDSRPRDNSGRLVHHDVGEHVKGARKDRWAQVHAGNLDALEAEGEGAAAKHVTKDAVMGETSAEGDQTLGSSAGAAHLKREIRRMVSSKPTLAGMDPKTARSAYVQGVEWLNEALNTCKTVHDLEDLREETRWMADGGGAFDEERVVDLALAQEMDQKFPRARWGSTTYLYPTDEQGNHLPEPEGGKMGLHFEVDTDAMRRAGFVVRHRSNGRTTIRKLSARQAPYKQWWEAMGPRFSATMGRDYSKSSNETWYGHRREGAKREKANDWSGLLSDENAAAEKASGPRLDVHKEIGIRRSGKLERIGGRERPYGVDGAKLAADFHLRAVQYGNWIDDGQASQHLRATYDALSDLADVLGADPATLAHGSKLALAFGARGTGHANAHYESDQAIINLTATRGGGTLAHEWAHFMDHQVPGGAFHYDEMTRHPSFASHAMHDTLPDEVRDAFDDVMEVLQGGVEVDRRARALNRRQRKMMKESRRHPLHSPEAAKQKAEWDKLRKEVEAHNAEMRAIRGGAPKSAGPTKFAKDARTLGEYWSRPHEMFARAFESYVEDKLEGGGRRNTYLVSGTREKLNLRKQVNGQWIEGLEVYPQADERARISEAFDELFKAMGRHETLRKAFARRLFRRVPAGARILVAG